MNTTKKKEQIIESMKDCYNQIFIPYLHRKNTIAHPNDEKGDIIRLTPSTVYFWYDEVYSSRALVDIVVLPKIPDEKLSFSRELLNIMNSDLACDHFCMIPECNTLVFRTSLYVLGDQLPRNKFKTLLSQFIFADYFRFRLSIEELLVAGGKPEEIIQSLGAQLPKEKKQHYKTDYERLQQGIKRVFAKIDLPVKDETITDNSVKIVSSIRGGACRFRLVAFAPINTAQLHLQMTSFDELPQNMFTEAVEMANMYNSRSYANHIIVSTRDKYVSLFTGVILDPVLDEEELVYQLKNLLSVGCRILPVFVGNNPANMSPKEHLKSIFAGCREKVIS